MPRDYLNYNRGARELRTGYAPLDRFGIRLWYEISVVLQNDKFLSGAIVNNIAFCDSDIDGAA